MSPLRAIAERFARADVVFWLMPPLIVLLIVGTIAQRYMGLYDATKLFFEGFIIWAGPVPLPGAFTLIGLITFSLFCKFILRSPLQKNYLGIYLTHLGALVLLLGGFFTAFTAKESYLLIPEGGENAFVYDYHKRNMMIFEGDGVVFKKDFKRFYDGQRLDFDGALPFQINVLGICRNCSIVNREHEDDVIYHSMARFMQLEVGEPLMESEANLSGLTLEITGLPDEQDGIYIAFEAMPKPIEIFAGDKVYKIIFGKEQRVLPFSVRLNDFVRQTYPGTNKSKEYSSDVTVIDGDVTWHALISMNKPLRYKGYTLYQSSFEQTPETELTILAVVENKGRLFPYIGTIIIALGLILHTRQKYAKVGS